MPADFHTPNTIFQEPQSSIIPHILLYIVQYIALISPQSQYRRVTFNVLIIGLAVYSLTHPHFTNDLTIAQPFNIGWSFYLATLAKLNFSDLVELDYWRVDEPAGAAGKYTAFGYAKTRWAMSLMLNTRGIRWNYEVKNVPSKPKQTKLAFVVSYALKFVKNLLLADLFFQLGIRLLYTTPDGQVGQMNSKYMTMRHKDWRWSFAKAFVFGATPYFAMSMQYAQFAIIAVLFGFTLPDDWPSMFNTIRGTTTIRDFWGRYWHQQLRHMLSQYTEAFCAFFGIAKGTNASSYTKLWLAFLISGTFHSLSSLQMPHPANLSAGERSLGFFWFFLWNVSAITLEDFIQWCARQFFRREVLGGERSWARTIIGYIWVTIAMWQGLPFVGDMCLRLRVGAESPIPFSLSKPYIERYVPIPP